jgi:integrase
MWIIPAARMKGAREHRVPLSDRAIEILESLPRDGGEFIFGRKAGKPLPRDVLQRTLKRIGRADVTAHGFRSTFRDSASEHPPTPGKCAKWRSRMPS